MLKGVRTAEDAHEAVESGVDGLLVSTHGGRQLDMTMGAIEMVPEIVEASRGHAEVYVDSGVRRGSDVIKALALGAKAVAIGRPLFWGLALDGDNGVHGVLELLPRRGRPQHGLLRPVRRGSPRAGHHTDPRWLGGRSAAPLRRNVLSGFVRGTKFRAPLSFGKPGPHSEREMCMGCPIAGR